jgi:hypothetical protein
MPKQRSSIALAIAVAIASVALSVIADTAKGEFVLKTVKVDLPVGDRLFPPGPGAEAANLYCLICHSAGMVRTQPAMTRSGWEAEINKMRNAYGAPVPEDQVTTIASYLLTLQAGK